MTYVRKTRDEWEIEGLYSGGWEIETTEDNSKAVRARLKECRDNVPGVAFRIIKRRVKIKDVA